MSLYCLVGKPIPYMGLVPIKPRSSLVKSSICGITANLAAAI